MFVFAKDILSFVKSMKGLAGASGNKDLVRVLVWAKQPGSGAADSRVREDGGSEEVGGLEWGI